MDLDGLRAQVADLNEQAARPDLWDDQEKAQKVTSQLSHKQGELRRITSLRERLEDLPLLYELAEEAEDADAQADADNDRLKLRDEIASLEVRTLLSGEYDERNALITIRAEAGGVDAADFAEMLLRMYSRWAERHNYGVEVVDDRVTVRTRARVALVLAGAVTGGRAEVTVQAESTARSRAR